MERERDESALKDIKIQEAIKINELEKEEKLVNLIVEIIVEATLKEFYEKSD